MTSGSSPMALGDFSDTVGSMNFVTANGSLPTNVCLPRKALSDET